MPETYPQPTPDTDASTFQLHRLESAWLAWRAGDVTPSWQQHLPAGDEPCHPNLIFNLLALDIQRRIQAGLPALLAEHYFEHPRLQRDDARLDDARQMELIQREYLLRLQQGERPHRAEYEAAFPQHSEALREMKPLSRCPKCQTILVLDETFQTWFCPGCGCKSLPTAPPFVAQTKPLNSAATELDPRQYELMEKLGGGGMGEVFRCCDPALGRDLAIKVILAKYSGHPDVERRFLREARITGSLQHPHIVPIYNLGRLADGRLHYTMRLVRGKTFADILKEEVGKLERLPYLLSSFEKICQAVAYAHSKHVIHRDLKPSNIMVGKFGEVQVMDWGLAKLLSAEEEPAEEPQQEPGGTFIHTEGTDTPSDLTLAGTGIGTPAYMSPEQAQGDWKLVDERADVFALGAILCEILTGQPPYSGEDSYEILRRAKLGDLGEALARLEQCEADPALVELCRECLAVRCEQRPRNAGVVAQRISDYQIAVEQRLHQAEVEQAAEVERAKAQLKVQLIASEERKRRRLLLALTFALLAGAVVSTAFAVLALRAEKEAVAERNRAREEETIARQERNKAQEAVAEKEDAMTVQDFLLENVLNAARPEGQDGGLGKNVTLRQAIDAAEARIAEKFKDRPLVEASVRFELATTYYYLGAYPQAIQQHQRALALREANLGPDHPDTLLSRNDLAVVYRLAGRTADAIRLLEQNLRQQESKHGPAHIDAMTARLNLAQAYWDAGRNDEAIELYEPTLKQMEDKLPEHDYTLICRNNLADAYYAAGRYADAIHLNEQTLEQRKAKYGLDHPETLISCINLGEVYRSAGRTADAIGLLEPTLKQMKVQRGPEHPDTLTCRNNLALAYLEAGRAAEAIAMLEPTFKQKEAQLGPNHPQTLLSMINLGAAYVNAGRLKDAIPLLEEALQRGRKHSKGYPPQLFRLPPALAGAYEQAGQLAKGEALYRDFLEHARIQFGADDLRTVEPMTGLGINLLN